MYPLSDSAGAKPLPRNTRSNRDYVMVVVLQAVRIERIASERYRRRRPARGSTITNNTWVGTATVLLPCTNGSVVRIARCVGENGEEDPESLHYNENI